MADKIINKIYHLADLHIRNLKRHKEYKEVFNKFLKQVKKDNIEDSIIYLAGDIAHAKTEMSPELVQEISWFLTECSKLREVVLITGNHDCNLNNNFRLDVLTPIIDNLNNPRIHYLRDTGIYNIHNLSFCVYSILDNKKNWPNGKDVAGENTICLFHGPVNDSETDIGYTVSSNSFTSDMFDGFDMALLGDIHKRQTIGGSHIAYAGSMIQQNHGESLEKHGYLLWDVPTRTFEEFNIPNDYGFYTLDVDNGVVPDVSDMPKKPRLRVRISNTDPSQIKRAITEIKKKYKVQEFTVTRMDTLSRKKVGDFDTNLAIGNIRDVEFQNELIKDYLERQYLADDTTIDNIQQINRDINTKLTDDDVTPNIQWIPQSFEFTNMFSYGEGNSIDFTKTKGIVGIFAPNASGKSALFDALSFCIYDKTSRTYIAKNILNNRKKNFICKLHFQIQDVDYHIERRARLINHGKNLKVDVDFWRDNGGEKESLNGEQRKDTNKNIIQYLGKYEDFVLTALSLQGDNALFIDKSQSERKEILAQFMGVDIFDRLYGMAWDENRDNASLIRKFKSDDFTTRLAEIETQLKSNKEEYKVLEKSQSNVKDEEELLNKKIISLNEKIIKLNADSGVSVEELEKRRDILQKKKNELKKQKDSIQDRITHREEQQITLDEILDKFDEEVLEQSIIELNEEKIKLVGIDLERDKIKIKLDSLYERKEHLDSHKYNEECDICMENSETILEQKEKVTENIKGGEDILQELNKNYIDSDIKLYSLRDYEKEYKNFEEAKQKEDKIDREISQLMNRLSTTETEELKISTQLTTQETLIEEYYSNEKQIKKNKEIRTEISSVRETLGSVKQNLKKINSDVLKMNGKISALQNQKETIEDRIQEVKDLEETHNLFEYYLNSLGRDGVSYELIQKALPMIEGEVNNILGQIVDFGMQLEMDGKNINAFIVYDDQRWGLEMCSGMERFISGLAIRIALINVCNLPRPNFLVIDEGFGTLDNENLTSLYMLFAYLKTQFDFVMIISHIDSMRDVVDSLVEIKKTNGFSNVKF
jgi:DNA repair exonuclease SbcCD ATPase subunit